MSMHSDQVNPDSNENPEIRDNENQANQLIDQFFSDEGVTIPADFRSGFVAIVGRPNVGKSTLMNHLLGQKLSITSRKPQTTRHKIVGIDSREKSQAVFVDTPGMHKKEVRAINKMMNRAAHSALRDVNLVLFVVDAQKWTQNDELVLEKLKNAEMPVILVINKLDTFENKNEALPLIRERAKLMNFAEIVPVSALRGANLDHLRDTIEKYLPFQPPLYSMDQITDRSERFLASEIIREKIMRQLGDELPYAVTIQIESFKSIKSILHIDAVVFVERDSQKAILIGKGGAKLKRIGTDARRSIESLLDQKVMLRLWAKVKTGWSDDERALKSLGYDDI